MSTPDAAERLRRDVSRLCSLETMAALERVLAIVKTSVIAEADRKAIASILLDAQLAAHLSLEQRAALRRVAALAPIIEAE